MLEHPNQNPGPVQRGDVRVSLVIGEFENIGEDYTPERVAQWGRLVQPLDGMSLVGESWDEVATHALTRLEELGAADESIALDYVRMGDPWTTAGASLLAAYLSNPASSDMDTRDRLRRSSALAFVLAFAAPDDDAAA
jgi:hypothetical protein